MAKTLKLKTRNCRIIANIIEKNAKKGLQFNLMHGFSNSNDMGCIGEVCRVHIRSNTKLKDSKKYSNVNDYYEAFKFLGIDPIRLNVPSSDMWRKYRDELNNVDKFDEWYNITAKHAVAMLRNLASGEWNVEPVQ